MDQPSTTDTSPEYETEEIWDGERWVLIRKTCLPRAIKKGIIQTNIPRMFFFNFWYLNLTHYFEHQLRQQPNVVCVPLFFSIVLSRFVAATQEFIVNFFVEFH